MKTSDETVLVTITKVTEQRTKPSWKAPGGHRRFQIDARRVSDPTEQVWCSTLDPWRASLCKQCEMKPTQLLLTVKSVTLRGRFGATSKVLNLVHVERPAAEATA